MVSETGDSELDGAYDLMDELWPRIKERWGDDPVGRLRHVIEANLEHQGPKPKPSRAVPRGSFASRNDEVQTFFKKGNK